MNQNGTIADICCYRQGCGAPSPGGRIPVQGWVGKSVRRREWRASRNSKVPKPGRGNRLVLGPVVRTKSPMGPHARESLRPRTEVSELCAQLPESISPTGLLHPQSTVRWNLRQGLPAAGPGREWSRLILPLTNSRIGELSPAYQAVAPACYPRRCRMLANFPPSDDGVDDFHWFAGHPVAELCKPSVRRRGCRIAALIPGR